MRAALPGGAGFQNGSLFLLRAGILANERRKNLHGGEAVEVCVAGFVDRTHAAFAEFVSDLMVAERFADHGECPHWHFAHCNQNDLKLWLI
jgi:hypothetical protein